VSLAPRCSSTFSFLTTINYITLIAFIAHSKSITIGYVRKTLRKEHDTPKRSRFRCLLEQGYSQRDTARWLDLTRGTASKWVSDRRTGKGRTSRPPIISDEKVEEIAQWMTGHFDRRALPLQEIARAHGIKASNNTILATFARRGYHYYIPDYKPFLSEATKRKR
jgi:transposase